ncbi:hypothetical protein GQ53DRAFT_726202 [Thozetella sp. PMI_491]|nr:hypothetical protein GQ53DRAFT_726202 [Thozetella sp. PMI_491]
MPDYLDFMMIFGRQNDARDLRFSGFREQNNLRHATSGHTEAGLARSGRQYQICFNLKGVTLASESMLNPSTSEWSIRQAAIYHRFDVVEGNAVWLVTKGRQDLKDRYKELTGDKARPEDKSFGTVEECFRSSLSALLLFCHWAMEDWHGYIKWLDNTIDAQTEMALYGPRGMGHNARAYTGMDIQLLLRWEEQISEAISVLEANVDVMTSLKKFYTGLRTSKEFPLRKSCADDIYDFTKQLENIINNLRMQISRAKPVVKLTLDRTSLVREHLQTQQAERLERLNQNMENEAVVMRIITIVTLIYLPATFVSTFFSTDIIKYQDTDNDAGSFSYIAMIRWLEVTLPLTFLTLVCAWLGKKWAGWHMPSQGVLSVRARSWWQWVVSDAPWKPQLMSRASTLLPLPASSKQAIAGP